MYVNFISDTVTFQGQNQPLTVTKSGHYVIPITPVARTLQDPET